MMDRESWEWVALLAVVGVSYVLKRIAKKDPFEGQLPDENSEVVKQLRRELAEKMAHRRAVTTARVDTSANEAPLLNPTRARTKEDGAITRDSITSVYYPEALASAEKALRASTDALAAITRKEAAFMPPPAPSGAGFRGQLMHGGLRSGVLWAEVIAPPLALRERPWGGHGTMFP